MSALDAVGASTVSGDNFDVTRFRRVNVIIFTTNGIFSGLTLCQHQQRLLDALNKGFYTSKLQTCSDFVPLFEVSFFAPGQAARHMDTAYIRKNNILFVGEQNIVSSTTQTNVYPMRRKKPLQAVINLPQVSLTGNMHSEMWEELQDALNRSDQFIPLTDVDFNPAFEGGIAQLDFVAVNKDHIVYVGK
ncbi:hypothetical protein ABFB09_03745 [Dehalogenimonas sp. THU2]|uniref:DUF6812 domain-containing protein n=1 Tax=Dehalogenimonas sp. THU2 TaxID=3151121 RepID=UPI003218597F